LKNFLMAVKSIICNNMYAKDKIIIFEQFFSGERLVKKAEIML
jgi:hypothetical protein